MTRRPTGHSATCVDESRQEKGSCFALILSITLRFSSMSKERGIGGNKANALISEKGMKSQAKYTLEGCNLSPLFSFLQTPWEKASQLTIPNLLNSKDDSFRFQKNFCQTTVTELESRTVIVISSVLSPTLKYFSSHCTSLQAATYWVPLQQSPSQ